MAEFANTDPAMFADHINSALVGELPSFGIATESKFQQLMQRNQGVEGHGIPHQPPTPQDSQNFKLDTSLSVEAKAFQPNTANQFGGQVSVASTINSFDALDINEGLRHQSTNNMQGLANPGAPNPVAREFVPRNMSAPNLNHPQQNGAFQNIPEFIPGRSMNMVNGVPQPNQFVQPQGSQFSGQPMMPGHPDSAQRMPNNTSSPMLEYLPGTHIPSPAPGQAMDPRLSSSSVFTSPQSQNTSSPFYAGEGNTPLTANSMGGKRRKCSKDLRASLKFIEDCVQKILNKKDRKVDRIEITAFSTPGTSSPFPRQPLDSLSTTHVTPERTSPLLTRRLNTHRGSPSLGPVSTGVGLDINPQQQYSEASDPNMMAQHVIQENGGTTYFFTQKAIRQNMSVVMPSFHMFPGSPPHIEYMSLKANAPSFFMSNDLRQVIMKKHALSMMTVDAEQNPSIPAEVDNYHSLFPLEAVPDNPLQKSNTYGFVTSCYKAIKYKDGLPYCLRRIHGFRQVTEKCMVLVEMWKKLQHANVVQLREVFTSKAFGEHSLIFAHDYYAGAETMMSRHFQNPNNNYASKKWNGGTTRQNAGLLPESLIWTYVVQLTSALRCIHTAGLACRVMDPTKILITDKSRIRINGVGIFDVLGYDSSHSNPRAHMQQYQQDDMVALGKVVLALACNSVTSIQRDNLPKSIELVVMNYSSDLKNLILYLLSPQQRPHSVNDIMPMIGARFYTQLDAAMMRCDVIENELAKEMENGRLFRLLAKLGVVNERPEFGIEPTWSETGDRYLLKLFRDHLFHQVTETGAPWVDLAHIVQCLNKLDSGVPEKVCLMSRDEQNVLVVSYAELKKAFVKCFNELVNTSMR